MTIETHWRISKPQVRSQKGNLYVCGTIRGSMHVLVVEDRDAEDVCNHLNEIEEQAWKYRELSR